MPSKPEAAPEADLYRAIGGAAGCLSLAAGFYARVDDDLVLRPLFPGKNHRCAIHAFAAFLVQFLGGPPEEASFRWWLSLRESHARFEIGNRERTAWLKQMSVALDEAPIGEPLRAALREFFTQSSAYLVNSGPAVHASGAASPGLNRLRDEFAIRWQQQLALEEAVAAIAHSDPARAIALANGPVLLARIAADHSLHAGLLAAMLTGGDPMLLRHVEERIVGEPALVEARYAGAALLHAAAARGRLTVVQLLLRMGADPNVLDGGSHTPLYSLANEYLGPEAQSLVLALVQAGADVNANGGAKRCTPLHMAARRGNVEVAAALLDSRADIEARDRLGDTPLRRAINCRRQNVADLLIARGADPQVLIR